MSLGFVRHILMQPWHEARQIGQAWLVWLALLTGVAVLGATVGSGGRNPGHILIFLPAAALIFFGWLQLVLTALKQTTPSNARLVPGLRRRVTAVIIATYIGLAAVIGAVCLSIFGTINWGLASVSIGGLVMATAAFSVGSRLAAWTVFVVFIGGWQTESGRQAAGLFFVAAGQ